MKAQILATKEINHRTWYLCRVNLLEYLNQLKPNFYEFAIQRRIVRNQYLDTLYKSVKSGDPIPIITLTYKELKLKVIESYAELDMEKVEILDGLQRTFRLWSYKILSDKYILTSNKKPIDFAKELKSENELFFESGVITTSLIREFIGNEEIEKIENVFSSFDIYFVIWTGLNENEVIEKMLVLNAGQKAVSKTHQFELMFLHFYDEIKTNQKNIILIREKDKSASNVKKGVRNIGEFMFSSVIVALQSLIEKKPVRVSTEGLIGVESDEETNSEIFKSAFSSEFIKVYLDELYKIDEAVDENDKVNGKEWFVKDTTLSGVFAAIGRHINLEPTWSKLQLSEFAIKGFVELRNKILKNGLNLNEFTKEYNSFSSRSVNIGSHIRKVIMIYILNLLEEDQASWKSAFEEAKKRGDKNDR